MALLWTLHPLQAEAVTYLVQRAESLMGLFYLLTMYGFIRGVEGHLLSGTRHEVLSGNRRTGHLPDDIEPSRSGTSWYALSAAACLAGMATKEVMVSAPLMVLFYDRTFVAGSVREAWRQRWRLYLGLGATWILLGWLVVNPGSRGGTAGFGAGLAWPAYALTQFGAIIRYLQLAVWPHPLVLDCGATVVTRVGEVAPYALILAGLAGVAVLARAAAARDRFCRRVVFCDSGPDFQRGAGGNADDGRAPDVPAAGGRDRPGSGGNPVSGRPARPGGSAVGGRGIRLAHDAAERRLPQRAIHLA